jgi:hypothetical protein
MNQTTVPDPKRSRSRWRLPFAPTFLIGLLLVPASALAANALVKSTPAAETAAEPTAGQFLKLNAAATDPAPSADAPSGAAVASPADVALACGSEGLALVDKESAGTISELEKAALDALRDVCDRAGMALPAAAAPVGETLTLAAGGAAAVDAQYDAFVAAYTAAEASINAAIAGNGDPGLINQAIDILATAQQAAQQGDYGTGIDRAAAASQTAEQALVAAASRQRDDDSHDDESHEGGHDDDSHEGGHDDD